MADETTDDTLTARQYRGLSALLASPTIRQAAEQSGIPEKTLHNWLRDTTFAAEYRAALREAFQHAKGTLQQGSGRAAAELVRLSVSAKSEAVRLGASRAVLEFAIKATEIEDLAARVAALEGKDVTSVS
jgi:oligoendopeptidase F